jgi:hypothetical protein
MRSGTGRGHARWLLGATAAAAIACVVAGARAQGDEHRRSDVELCFSAAEAAQPLMKERKLRAAQRKLQACARDECPRQARADCRTWLADVTRAIPTVIFSAREESAGGTSRAVDDVRISVDGEVVVPARIDTTAVALDPGVHTVRFEHGEFAPVEQRIDVREGESRREIDVVFRPPAPSSTGGASRAAAPAGPAPPDGGEGPSPVLERPSSSPVPVATYALGAGAIVALGVGITMEVIGLSDRQHLVDTCQATRSCAPSDVDAAHTRVLAGDVALGVGAALAVGAVYVYLSRDPSPSSPPSGVRLRVGPTAAGVGAAIEGSL